jgi:hypothetical protein
MFHCATTLGVAACRLCAFLGRRGVDLVVLGVSADEPDIRFLRLEKNQDYYAVSVPFDVKNHTLIPDIICLGVMILEVIEIFPFCLPDTCVP